jgi:hypothetical protein
MIRKQLYLDDDLDHELKLLSGRTGLSEAEHVRRALRRYLEGEHAGSGFAPLVELASNGATRPLSPTTTARIPRA